MKQIANAAVAAALAMGVFAAPATAGNAKPPAYTGTWAQSLAECKTPLDDKDGPAVISATDYTQSKTHCTFGPVVYRRYAWHTKVTCDATGTKPDDSLEISVSGDALMLVWAKSQATVDYARCK